MRWRLSLAAALAVAVILAFETKSEIGLAIVVGLFIPVMIYDTISGIITGLREMRTMRFWIVAVGLALVSLATLKLR